MSLCENVIGADSTWLNNTHVNALPTNTPSWTVTFDLKPCLTYLAGRWPLTRDSVLGRCSVGRGGIWVWLVMQSAGAGRAGWAGWPPALAPSSAACSAQRSSCGSPSCSLSQCPQTQHTHGHQPLPTDPVEPLTTVWILYIFNHLVSRWKWSRMHTYLFGSLTHLSCRCATVQDVTGVVKVLSHTWCCCHVHYNVEIYPQKSSFVESDCLAIMWSYTHTLQCCHTCCTHCGCCLEPLERLVHVPLGCCHLLLTYTQI